MSTPPAAPQPRQLVLSLLVALGVITLVKDLLQAADRIRMKLEAERPEGLHDEIQDYLKPNPEEE